MKKRFKLKIRGESPRSLFLAFVLAKLKCDVYLFDFLKNNNSKKDNQIFLFSDSSKDLLNKFDIWNEIKDISYGFTSLSINDNLISELLLLRNKNFTKKYLNTIGWTANYSDIKKLLTNKLINYDNVYFISKNQSIDQTLIFDYEFNFKDYDKTSNLFKLPLSFFKRIDEQILIFNVYLRGHIEKRLYVINTTMGLLVLTPLNKNLYQIIWKNASNRLKETSLKSKSFFLDNLTTLLPKEFLIDQIIGDIKFLHVNDIYSCYLIKNKSIYLNENKFKSNFIYDLNFDIIIRNILQIYNFVGKNYPKSINIYKKFGVYYLLRKYLEIKINFSFPCFLLNLFKLNNIFLLSIRKIIFILIKRINFIRILFMRNIMNLNINNFNEIR